MARRDKPLPRKTRTEPVKAEPRGAQRGRARAERANAAGDDAEARLRAGGRDGAGRMSRAEMRKLRHGE